MTSVEVSGVGLAQPLCEWAAHIERLEWSAVVLDRDWRLVYASSELKQMIGASDDSELGYGAHVLEAFAKDAWLRTVHPDSQVEVFNELAPFVVADFARRGHDPADVLPERFKPLLAGVVPAQRLPYMWSSSFLYVDPAADLEVPPRYRVNMCFVRLHADDGEMLGWLVLFFLGLRPSLVSLLAGGDERMYERMARLVEPSPHQAAILFCDLHQSGRLSRQLPSIAYFKLVRRLWTGIDAAVADETGIIGKHAGDGASAYFLVDDVGSPSQTAAAAIRTARRIHEISAEVFRETMDSECLMKIGLHWGGSLYMGQLVPAGRLDVTALGDEVNEAARIEECAGSGETLISKELLEQLTLQDAAGVGIEVEKLSYTLIEELPGASEKARRDAGSLAVTTI